jgi:hypothetical protein
MKGKLFALEHFLGAKLPVSFLELRFVVKKIEMGGCPDQMKINDILCLGRKVREWILGSG